MKHEIPKYLIVVVPGWRTTRKQGWFPWLERAAANLGTSFEIIEAVPNITVPRRHLWVKAIARCVENAEKNGQKVILIGHSMGCWAISSYLLQRDKPIEATIFIAPSFGWIHARFAVHPIFKHLSLPFMIGRPVSPKQIINKSREYFLIYSSTDKYISTRLAKHNAKKLQATTHHIADAGHFGEKDGYLELPLLGNILDELVS